MVVGKPFTIECSVPAVKPLQSLTLTLFHGKETLQKQTFREAAPVLQEATITFNSTAHREDGLLNFSCQAELDLRAHGGRIFHSMSEPQILEIYGEETPWTQKEGGSIYFGPLSLLSGELEGTLNPEASLFPASLSPQPGPQLFQRSGELN